MKRNTKQSSRGSSSGSRLRLTILLATVAAFMLVAAANAAAAATYKISLEGPGTGEVSSVGGFFVGTPPAACQGPPATGTCEGLTTSDSPGVEGIYVKAVADPGSEFVGWEVEEGHLGGIGCEGTEEQCFAFQFEGSGENVKLVAYFESTGPTGPTNRRTLTLTKSPSPSAGAGQGTVKSKPKGINCAVTCAKATASLYKNTPVTLTAKPSATSSFVKWSNPGGACDESALTTCTVPMAEDESLEAVFTGTSKAILNPMELTLAKAGTGHGTVKSKPGGIYCEADCTEAEALFTSGDGGNKLPASVVLTATTAPGSEFNGWSGCASEPEPEPGLVQCQVTMSAAKAVSAEFTALPSNTLTVVKSPSPGAGAGAGTVKSKPKGINCPTGCSETAASFSEDTTVVLTATAANGSTFAGWSGGGCSGTGTCTVPMTSAATVTATFTGTSKAILNPMELTLTKAGSGLGTVKSKPAGIFCEVLCSSDEALYTSGDGGNKLPASVVLTATTAAGSQPVVWSGCDAEPEPEPGLVQCQVTMETAKAVTATFDELP